MQARMETIKVKQASILRYFRAMYVLETLKIFTHEVEMKSKFYVRDPLPVRDLASNG